MFLVVELLEEGALKEKPTNVNHQVWGGGLIIKDKLVCVIPSII